MITAFTRVRISEGEAHYGGNLVDGAHILEFFGDLATEIAIRNDGDEGLFRAYENIEFLAPVYAGDFLEMRAELIGIGTTSRRIQFVASKVITPRRDVSDSAADVLDEPQVVVRATGTVVVKAECQRKRG